MKRETIGNFGSVGWKYREENKPYWGLGNDESVVGYYTCVGWLIKYTSKK